MSVTLVKNGSAPGSNWMQTVAAVNAWLWMVKLAVRGSESGADPTVGKTPPLAVVFAAAAENATRQGYRMRCGVAVCVGISGTAAPTVIVTPLEARSAKAPARVGAEAPAAAVGVNPSSVSHNAWG